MSVDNLLAEKQETKHISDYSVDWASLREQSLKPGGFAEQRVHLWPLILGIQEDSLEYQNHNATKEQEHPDERQIRLDTDRSFVLYPDDDSHSGETKEKLQSELHDLLISIFRRRQKLRYFQGYHDIITVLFLTLPPPLRLRCAEQLSLHRLRDSMGPGLEPVIGLLHVLQNLLRLVDPSFANLIESAIPLPYYALSNLLTLFSHDVPTLSMIQHLFDYILCRPPLIIVYIAAALVLTQKPDVLLLEEQDEEGMIHSLLNRLPYMVDSYEDVSLAKVEKKDSSDALGNINSSDSRCSDSTSPGSTSNKLEEPEAIMTDNRDTLVRTENETGQAETHQINMGSSAVNEKVGPTNEDEPAINDVPTHVHELANEDTSVKPEPKDTSSESLRKNNPRGSSPEPLFVKKPPLVLCSLLRRSDELFRLYPPTHPELALSTIMGPQSVIFTWSTDFNRLPPDEEAEAMVEHPDLVVRPPPSPHNVDAGSKPPRKQQRSVSQSQVIWTSAIIVVGVAAALYGLRTQEGTRTLDALKSKDWRRVGHRLVNGWW